MEDLNPYIVIAGGHKVLIDKEDVARVSKHRWYLDRWNNYSRIRSDIDGHWVTLSRFIMNPPKNKLVDHINHDTLDNRRSNLRVGSKAENQQNQKPGKRGKGNYKGVSLLPWGNYAAYIQCSGKRYSLGCYRSEELAAAAYNGAANVLFGKWACINDV